LKPALTKALTYV